MKASSPLIEPGCHGGRETMLEAAKAAGKTAGMAQLMADYPRGPHDQPQSMCPAFGALRVGLRMKRTTTILSGSACCVYGLTFTSHFYGARRSVGYVPFNSETLVTGKLFEDIRDAVQESAKPEDCDAVVVINLCVPTASGVPLDLLPRQINGVRIIGIDVPGFGVPTHAEAKDVLAAAMLRYARQEAEAGPVARPHSLAGDSPMIALIGELFPADPVGIGALLAPLGLSLAPQLPSREWRDQYGALDCAGGIVVHTTAGVSALVVAALMGGRQGFPKTLMLPHSPALTMAGAALLWVGWFGFNAGSNLEANGVTALAFINTLVATAAATLSWIAGEALAKGKASMLGAASGAVAGLVAVTPACGFVGPMGAIIIGLIAGLICLWGVSGLKRGSCIAAATAFVFTSDSSERRASSEPIQPRKCPRCVSVTKQAPGSCRHDAASGTRTLRPSAVAMAARAIGSNSSPTEGSANAKDA